MIEHHPISTRFRRRLRPGGETGAVVVVVMMFVMIFLIVGVALYFLVASQTRATETERTDVKSFNVAEAGIDAGMLALKLGWPTTSDKYVTIDHYALKESLQGDPDLTGLWDPSRSDATEFLQVDVYDNIDATGNTNSVPNMDPATRVVWDSNADGLMFVDATANVDDDRHRILIMAEQHYWRLSFPLDMALVAGNVFQNGAKALRLAIEDGPPASYYVEDPSGWDEVTWSDDYTFTQDGTSGLFDQILNDAMMNAIMGIAIEQGFYYAEPEYANPASGAQGDLLSGAADGQVVYIDVDSGTGSVDIAGNTQIGSVDEPVLVVIDTRDAPGITEIGWDMKGSADFYGVLITLGDAELRGTCSNHGAVYCEGLLSSHGLGSDEEIFYNIEVIRNINRIHTLSVNILPNTWEEYTLPRTETTTGS